MLDSIRNQKRLLFAILLFLILPSFVFFGVQGYDRFLGNDDSLATVGRDEIRQPEFDEALRRQMDRFRQMFGGSVDPKLMDTPQLRGEVLESLITRRALAQEANDRRILVGDAELQQAILSQAPELRKPDGSFDLERYRSLLAAQGLNESTFERQLRADLATQALPEAVSRTAFVPKAVAERLAAIGEQVREVREQRFSPADFASRVEVKPEALKAYYEANGRRWETPETARVEYVVLSAEALASQVQVPADDVRTYYEQNKAKYGTPEERRASHILVTVPEGASDEQKAAARAKAQQILERVRANPGEFAAIAKAESQDPGSASQGGDLGFFTRDTMVKPFADAAFALDEGKVSDLVETQFGYHVIRVTGAKPSSVKPFEQVRPEIEAELRRQLAGKRFSEQAEAFSNLVEDQSDSLKPAADKFGLKLQAADEVGRQGVQGVQGGQGGQGAPAGSPLSNPKLLAALFADESIRGKRNTQAIDVAPGTLVAARVVEHRPAARKPFESVEADVRAAYVAEQSRKLAQQAGEERLKALRAGGAPSEGFGPVKALSRVEPGELPQPAQAAVFGADASKLPAYAGADLGEQGYAVYAIQAVRAGQGSDAAKARAAELAQRLTQVTAQQELAAWTEALKARAKIERHPERLAAGGSGDAR